MAFESRVSALMLLLTGVLLVGCDTTFTEPGPAYEDYFPLRVGARWDFQVDSVIYRETTDNDTTSWLVREEVVDSYTDLEGLPAFVIRRSMRADASANWRIEDTWTARLNGDKGEKVEDNLRFIRLVFPPSEGLIWKGHAYLGGLATIPVAENCNNLSFLEDWDFTYGAVHRPWSDGSLSFDSTLTVLEAGEINLIEFNEAEAVYAIGVGMVYRRFAHLTTQTICPDCPWEEKAECGYSFEQRLVDWE